MVRKPVTYPPHVVPVAWRRKRPKLYGRGSMPEVLTCRHALNPGEPGGSPVLMEWDYQIDWPSGGRPGVVLVEYRCYRESGAGEGFDLVERIEDDIPVSEAVLAELAHHAARAIIHEAELRGSWAEVGEYFLRGAVTAARHGRDLVTYRQDGQAWFKLLRAEREISVPERAASAAAGGAGS